MGLLGGQYLQRETLAAYCEETGAPCRGSGSPKAARIRSLEPPSPAAASVEPECREDILEPEQPPFIDETAAAGAADAWLEPDEPAPDRHVEAPEPAVEEPPTEDPPAEEPLGKEPVADAATDDPPRPASWDVSPAAIAWPPPPRAASPRRRIVLLAGGMALALASLAGGYILGQGGDPAPQPAPSAAAPGEAPTAEVGALRDDLTRARQKVAILAAALDRTEKEKAVLAAELYKKQRALDAAAALPDASGPASAAARAAETDAKIAALTAQLAAARAKIASLNETAADRENEAVKRRLIEAATTASAQAMSFKAELDDARQRIGALELEAQTAKAEADTLAAELTASRQQNETVPARTSAPRSETEPAATDPGGRDRQHPGHPRTSGTWTMPSRA